MTPRPDLQRSLDRRRFDAQRIEAFQVKNTSITGRELIVVPSSGDGEVVVTVMFPTIFDELPNFTYGAELEERQVITAGAFPTLSAVVLKWEKRHADRLGGGFYSGAQIIVVATGGANQRIYLHWRFEGKALRNPAEGD